MTVLKLSKSGTFSRRLGKTVARTSLIHGTGCNMYQIRTCAIQSRVQFDVKVATLWSLVATTLMVAYALIFRAKLVWYLAITRLCRSEMPARKSFLPFV